VRLFVPLRILTKTKRRVWRGKNRGKHPRGGNLLAKLGGHHPGPTGRKKLKRSYRTGGWQELFVHFYKKARGKGSWLSRERGPDLRLQY